ncbi:MAG: response regulator [Deltaproteobacteria bacterium]|nr:response regulator [Deltaproteobacteria bacterium]
MPYKKTILIVEDEAIVAEDIRRTLERLGYGIAAVAASGPEALAAIAVAKPDLVLMDIVLQGEMSGIRTAEIIRADHQIPVIFLTAYADADTLARAKITEPFGYILKPFEDRSLHTAIEIAQYKNEAEKRIAHLNDVLRAIRNVNQLIVRERNLDRLIQQACDLLVETRGYHQAWIVLLDEELRGFKAASAGLSSGPEDVLAFFQRSQPPECAGLLQEKDMLCLPDILAACPAFPVNPLQETKGAFLVRLKTSGRFFGLLGVVLPGTLIADEEEQALCRQVAEDIAYAIHGIYLAEQVSRTEAERRQTVARLDAIFQHTPNVAIQGFDKEGRLLYWNKTAEAILGRPENSEGWDIGANQLFLPDGEQSFQAVLAEVDRTGLPYGPREFYFYHPSGYTGVVCAAIFAIPVEQHPREFICMSIDVTDRKQAEENRARLEAQLQQTHKLEAIGTLAGGIAHDFNNILSAILGYAELSLMNLEKESDHSQISKNLQAVLQAGNRARDLVRQILTFSRRAEEKSRPVQVSLVVKEALKLLRSSIPSTIGIQVHLEADTDLVWAEPAQIHQVVMNLCTNAYQAMQKKGGVLGVSVATVPMTPDLLKTFPHLQDCQHVRLTVRDTGEGMPQWIKERIFEPYFTTKGPGEGTGLGLSVVHGIVMHLQGAVEVESVFGRGSTFQVYIPCLEGVRPPEIDVSTFIPKGVGRILFVDDEAPIVDLVDKLLQHLGYRVTATTSSEEALKIFQADPEAFDLVITDLTMPHITGLVLARKLLQQRPDLPIILCSGYSDTLVAAEMKKIGIREFLMKPINVRTYAESIKRVLDSSRHSN